ncbi:PepSY domain-containing protein [Streptomyces sp. NBC_00876]|uniref:PepSY domain-containing protein n=1 Tax=Streptomyces sp. NBC_00876 TaxID=2975853 RepID=UPI0038645F1D|nr:PepSY domain-containing protein [Streptomyces sp. NBC_00876]
MKRKFVIAAVTAAVLVGGTAATAVAFADDDSHDSARSSTASGATARVAVGDAAAAAVRAVPGTVTEAELDDEDGGLVWELDVYGSDKSWHDVTVDAGNGKVLGKHVDDDRDRHAPRQTSVTLDEAVAAALKSAPGTVTSVELDGHDGRSGGATHWEVDVRGKDGRTHELNVDAKTAAVTADRSDDRSDDRPDGRHGDDGKGDDRDDD